MIEIRPLSTHKELREAVKLQQEIWGFEEIDLIPLRMFVVATKIGGQVLGAFDDKRMIAFLVAIPGVRPGGKSYLHSHMLGVLPEYRNLGIGRKLKLAQRDEALERGIDLIEWTFDPLELKNAYFNIERLGAIVRRYVVNQYGITSSQLGGSLPSDRCIAEWWIDTPRVRAILEGNPALRCPTTEQISIPSNIGEIKFKDPERGRAIQKKASEQFLDAFSRGLAVTGFDKTEETGTYLLGPWDSN